MQLAIVHPQTGKIADSKLHHGKALRRVGLRGRTVRGLGSRQQTQLSERQYFPRLLRGAQMAVMNGVEGATENPDHEQDAHRMRRGTPTCVAIWYTATAT